MPGHSTSTLSPELIAQIRRLQLRGQRLVTTSVSGEWASAFRGRGMEFEEVREYVPGDDVRSIDWNVTARSGSPHIKVFREERELSVMLVVDVSASGTFGSENRLKREVAAEVAAILAYTAIRSNDRIGALLFSDRIEQFIPAKKGRAHVWRVIRDVLTCEPSGRGTDLSGTLEHLNRTLKRSSVVFVISDFLAADQRPALKRLRARHDVTAVTITDPREFSLPKVGLVEIEDAETGERRVLDTSSSTTRNHYKNYVQARNTRQIQLFDSLKIGCIPVNTGESPVEPILRYFRSR